MKSNIRRLNIQIILLLISYAIIVNANEHLSMFMIQVILANIFVLPYYVACIYVFFGLGGIILLSVSAARSNSKIRSKKILAITGIGAVYVPLIFNHLLTPFDIRLYDSRLYILPEIAFVLLSIYLLFKLIKMKSSTDSLAPIGVL